LVLVAVVGGGVEEGAGGGVGELLVWDVRVAPVTADRDLGVTGHCEFLWPN